VADFKHSRFPGLFVFVHVYSKAETLAPAGYFGSEIGTSLSNTSRKDHGVNFPIKFGVVAPHKPNDAVDENFKC
jgi:hypothetical protein